MRRQWRMTHARDVEGDDFPAGHPACNGFEQFDIAPDSVEKQQRYTGSLSGLVADTQYLTIKLQHLRCEVPAAAHRVAFDAVFDCRIHAPRPSITESVDASHGGVARLHECVRPIKACRAITAGCAVHASGSCP